MTGQPVKWCFEDDSLERINNALRHAVFGEAPADEQERRCQLDVLRAAGQLNLLVVADWHGESYWPRGAVRAHLHGTEQARFLAAVAEHDYQRALWIVVDHYGADFAETLDDIGTIHHLSVIPV